MTKQETILQYTKVVLLTAILAFALWSVGSRPPIAHAQMANPGGFSYAKITTNASTIVKSANGQLHSVIVSSPGTTWTMQIFDNASACSGTAIFGATAVTVPAVATSLQFDVQANNGICVLTAGTTPGELTVAYR